MKAISNHPVAVFFFVLLLAGRAEIVQSRTTNQLDSKMPNCSSTQALIKQEHQNPWHVREQRVGSSELFYVYFLNGLRGWVAGGHRIYQTSDGGKTWKQSSLVVPDGLSVRNIFFVQPSIGWLVLDSSLQRNVRLMHTKDGGASWSPLISKKGFGGKVFFADRLNGWFVYNENHIPPFYRPAILHTNDGGNTWVDTSRALLEVFKPSETGYREAITHVIAQSASEATLSTLRGRVFTTANHGRTWRENAGPCEGNFLAGRFGIRSRHLHWMAEGADSIEGYWGLVHSQQEDGRWLRYQLPGFALTDAAFRSESEVFAAGSSIDKLTGKREATVLYSSDKGKNWFTIYRNPAIRRIYSLVIAEDRKILYAAGENGLFLSLELPPSY